MYYLTVFVDQEFRNVLPRRYSFRVLDVDQSQCTKAVRQEEFPLTQGSSVIFVILRPSTDWMRLTHIREDNLLYPVYGFKCKSCSKTPSQKTSRIMFDQVSGHPMAQLS